MRAALLVLLVTLGAGCSVADVFVCERDEQCMRGGSGGRCEATGACSFADPLCGSGWRYAALAPSALAEECVGDLPIVADAAPVDAAVVVDAPQPDDGPAIPDAPRPDATAPPPDAAAFPDGAIVELVFPVAADTSLKSTFPTTSFGDSTELRADASAVALLRFDVGSVGTRSVSAAFLHVTTAPGGGLSRGSVEIFRLLESWSEASATWNERQSGIAWSGAGASAPGSRDGTVLGSATPISDDTEYVIALPGALVEGWARNGATNDGIVLETRDQLNRALSLVSREGGGGKAPFLRVRLGP